MTEFHTHLQSAPTRQGTIGGPSLGSWTGSSTPTMSRTYLGADSKTLTFTTDTAGTVGSGSVVLDFSDGTLSGELALGSSYTADDVLQVMEGVSVSFDAGTIGGSFTVALTAINALRDDHIQIVGDLATEAIEIGGSSADDRDESFRTYDQTMYRDQRAILRRPRCHIDYVDNAGRRLFQRMQHSRHQVTLAENYDQDTVLLYRGGRGLLPLVGPYPTFTRSGARSYYDPDDDLWKGVADGEPVYTKPLDAQSGVAIERVHFLQEQATNEIVRAHPESGNDGWTVQAGSPTLSLDTVVPDIIDSDSTLWPSAWQDGVLKVEGTSGDSIRSDDLSGLTASFTYHSTLWIRGRGAIGIQHRTGSSSPPGTTRDTTNLTLDGTEGWQRVRMKAPQGGTDTYFGWQINFNELSVIWISVGQLTVGAADQTIIPSSGGSAVTHNADTLEFGVAVPEHAGTLSFWVQYTLRNAGGVYRFVNASGAKFAVDYDAGNEEIDFITKTSGNALSAGATLTTDELNLITVRWKRGDAGELYRSILLNGTEIGNDTTSDWEADWPSPLQINETGTSTQHAVGVAEIRMDRAYWTDSQCAQQYARLTESAWINLHNELAGRYFWISNSTESRLDAANPDKWLLGVALEEASVESDSLVLVR